MYSLRSRTRGKATAGQSTDDDNASAEQDFDTARGKSARGVKRQKNKGDSVNDLRKRAKKIKQDVDTKESQNNANEAKEDKDIKKNESFDKEKKTEKGKVVKESENIDKANEAVEDKDIKKSESFEKEKKTKRGKVVKESLNIDNEAKEDKDIKNSESFDKENKTKNDKVVKKSENIDKANKAKEDKDMKESKNLENKTKEDKDVKKIQNNNKGNSSKDSDNLEKTTKQDMKEKKQNEIKHVKECQNVDKGSSSKESNKDYITNMPQEILLKIFSTLSMEDLLNVQLVSPKLKPAAHDGSLWKELTLEVYSTNPLELKKMPAIGNIEGYCTNAAIETILNYAVDLRSLNCIFSPDITESQMKQVVNKYKKLQSITVNMCTPNALGCLKILKCSKSLKMIKLFFKSNELYSSNNRMCLNFQKLSSTFAKEDDFPLLENVEVKLILSLSQVIYGSEVMSCVSNILENKSQQLKYLLITGLYGIDASVLRVVNKCTKLQELSIRMFAGHSFTEDYDINGLTELKSLNMTVEDRHSNCTTLITRLSESLYRGSWSHLTHATFRLIGINEDYDVPLLKSIIDNMKALKTLIFESHEIVMEELSNIGSLERLESLHLNGVKVSNIGVSYLSHCNKLKILYLKTNYPLPDSRHIAEMLGPMGKLETFHFIRRSVGCYGFCSQNQIREWISSVLH